MCLPVVAVLWSVETQEAFELLEGAHVCVWFVFLPVGFNKGFVFCFGKLKSRVNT